MTIMPQKFQLKRKT